MSWAKLEQEANEKRYKLKAFHRHAGDGGNWNFDDLANRIMQRDSKEGNNSKSSSLLNSANTLNK